MELATVTLGAALLMVSGGFRLSRASLVATTCTGLFLYLWFAAQTRVSGGQVAVHLVVLLAIAAAVELLTRQVRRAVRSEVARVTLSRFLPDGLVEGAHHDPLALVSRPRSVEATVLVSDIRGFTRWAEDRAPLEVLTRLNVLQGKLAAVVREHGGMVDKFMGDGMLAVFGVPEERSDHAARALAAAVDMQRAVRELPGEGEDGFTIGVGVHTGELVVGVLGSGVRMEFTVLGDTVNTASRLESRTKDQGLPVLISAATVRAASAGDRLRRVGEVTLRGRIRPIELWTLPD
jgi:class 3 adenylate cyclase